MLDFTLFDYDQAAPHFTLFDYDQAAPLDLEVISTQHRDGTAVEDITYDSPKGGKVPAYLIVPPGNGPFAG